MIATTMPVDIVQGNVETLAELPDHGTVIARLNVGTGEALFCGMDVTDIEEVLAKNFDLQQSAVQLVSWSRLH